MTEQDPRELILTVFYASLRRRHLWIVVVGLVVVMVAWAVVITVPTPEIKEHAGQFKGMAVLIFLWDIYLIVYLDIVRYRIKHRLFGSWKVEIEILRDFLRKHGKDFDVDSLRGPRNTP